VIAPAAGIVALAARIGAYGNIIVLDHGQTLLTACLHLKTVQVEEGQRVEAGQVIGTVGETGLARGPHLHFGVYIGGVAVDPAEVLARGIR
jgi:murein DD-endopeptidase MepM/ murein hydrolase activator NlpD